MLRHTLLGLAAALSSLSLAWAGDAPPKPPPPKSGAKPEAELERLQAWAEHVEYHADTGKFSFAGDVIIIKGDMRVDCRKMDGTVDPKTRQFIKLTAVGDVQMASIDTFAIGGDGLPKTKTTAPDAWRATCDLADYDLREGRMTLTSTDGKTRPRLWRAKGYGEADTIIFIPNKGEYELIGNPVIRGEIPTGPPTKAPAPKPEPAKAPPVPSS